MHQARPVTDWQARDAQREALEEQMKAERAEHRAKHVATVSEALVARWPSLSATADVFAEVAVDALLASGVVFASIYTGEVEAW